MTKDAYDRMVAKRQAFLAAGRCPYDGRPLKPGRKRCRKCLQAARESEASKAVARAGVGLCIDCAVRPPDPGVARCARCRRRCLRRSAAVRRRYMDLGLCVQCGREPACADGTTGKKCRRLRRKRHVPTGRPVGRPRKVPAPLPELPAVDPRQTALFPLTEETEP